MGRPNKKPVIVVWLKSLTEERRVNLDTFISNIELYDYFTSSNELNYIEILLKGFTTLLNCISDENEIR